MSIRFPIPLPSGPLMADVEGTTLDASERDFLLHPSVGAVILFSRNYESREQISMLIREIRELRTPPLLVAVDQEGGRVQRFREEFHLLPAMRTLGLMHRQHPDRAHRLASAAGRLMAGELRRVGVDFSFAPVLDIANPDSRVIGDRAIDANVATLTAIARCYIEGMSDAGMMATGKHFPGHGGVREDSHREVPVDRRPMAALWQADLVPYRTLAELLGGIMTAHVQFPAVDERLPTYSSYWIGEVLRRQIGFQGIVFSDDLSMEGAAMVPTAAERARLALISGCDMVLVCNNNAAAREVADNLAAGKFVGNPRLQSMAGSPPRTSEDELAYLAETLQPLLELA